MVARSSGAARLRAALERLDHGETIETAAYGKMLQACAESLAIAEGRRVHGRIVQDKLDRGTFLGTCIVKMYARVGDLAEAHRAFHRILEPSAATWTVGIAAFSQSGHYRDALRLFNEMKQEGSSLDLIALITVLGACGDCSALEEGKKIHALATECGLESDVSVGTALINMYGKCRKLEAARRVFGRLSGSGIFPWCAMLGALAYSDNHAAESFGLYRRVLLEGIQPDAVTVITCLSACVKTVALDEGRALHAQVREAGMDVDVVVSNALINMYSKCGSPESALLVFDRMTAANVISWTSIIGAFSQEQGNRSFVLFRKMQLEGVRPNMVTFVNLLGGSLTVEQGRTVHDRILEAGLEATGTILGNSLVDMYCKCGELEEAGRVWSMLSKRDVISWNIMITGCAQQGHLLRLMDQFFRMHQDGLLPTKVTYLTMLSAFSSEEYLQEARLVHLSTIDSDLDSDEQISNCLLNMYGKCGTVEEVSRIFSRISDRSSSTWNALLTAHVRSGKSRQAIRSFQQMKQEGVKPDAVTFVIMLSAFGGPAFLLEGVTLHGWLVQLGLETLNVSNALIGMYSKCDSLEDAVATFDRMAERDRVSWNSMISGYVQHRRYSRALCLFRNMKLEGLRPNQITYLSTVEACQSPDEGRFLEWSIQETGYHQSRSLANALIVMYGRCGCMNAARNVFYGIGERDAVSWNTLMTAYVEQGSYDAALGLFWEMDVAPVSVSFVAALNACAGLTNLVQGRRVHSRILEAISKQELVEDVVLATALVNMYGKCGCLDQARQIFDSMEHKDLVTWTSLIVGYSQHSRADEAFRMMKYMQQSGVKPDYVLFISVLSGCDHGGMLEQGCRCFGSMVDDYGIFPRLEHYSCMIDVLGRAGHLDVAERLLHKSGSLDPKVWVTLLSACNMHKDVERGQRASSKIMELDPEKTAAYVVMSSIYGAES